MFVETNKEVILRVSIGLNENGGITIRNMFVVVNIEGKPCN